MLRMSFMEHLEELRSRIIRALYGLADRVRVCRSLFASKLWDIVSDPAVEALKHLDVEPPQLAQLTPMEAFSIIWMELPLLCSVFIASPWIVYQVWAFISPGLYKKEKRLALPFVLLTAGLFISGGIFAYFLAFRYGLEFLLGIGMSNNVRPVVSITEYFDLFVNVTLGVALVFELPVVIFLLTLLRILSPALPAAALPLCDSDHRYRRSHHHAHAGRVQFDVVRRPDVPALLRGRIRGPGPGDASRRPQFAVAQAVADHLSLAYWNSDRTCVHALPSAFNPEVALPDPVSSGRD